MAWLLWEERDGNKQTAWAAFPTASLAKKPPNMQRVPAQPAILRDMLGFWEAVFAMWPGARPAVFHILPTLPSLTYYAVASDLIVLSGQGGLMKVTVQVPRSPRS